MLFYILWGIDLEMIRDEKYVLKVSKQTLSPPVDIPHSHLNTIRYDGHRMRLLTPFISTDVALFYA